MHKNFVGGFDCRVCPPRWLRPNPIYTRIKLCDKQFW